MAFAVVFMLGGLMGSLTTASVKNAGAAASGLAPSPTVTATCAPVATMSVNEGDLYLRPTTPTELPAGTIAITVTNQGALHHEFVIVSGDPTGTVGATSLAR